MKKILLIVLVFVLGLAVFIGSGKPVTAQSEDPLPFSVDQIIIKYNDGANLNQAEQAQITSQMQRLNDAAGVGINYFRPMSGDAHVLRLEEPLSVGDAVSVTAQLGALPEVEYAEPDYKAFPLEKPFEIFSYS